MQTVVERIGDWLSPPGDDETALWAWRRGHHRYQLIVDTLAYSHNVPVRILLVDKLLNLPRTISRLLADPSIAAILRKDVAGLSDELYADVASEKNLSSLRDWITGGAFESPPRPLVVDPTILQALLCLVPYLERKVWLTEMGNALPVHALSRMQDLWALFVLMWTWSNAAPMSQQHNTLDRALGIEGLSARTLVPFLIREPEGPPQRAVPIIGPYFESESPNSISANGAATQRFVVRFEQLLAVANSLAIVGDPRQEGAPTRDELHEAAAIRIPHSPEEALLRAKSVDASLDYIRSIESEVGLLELLPRHEWEILAGNCSWLARWDSALIKYMRNLPLYIAHDGSATALVVRKRQRGSTSTKRLLSLTLCRYESLPQNAINVYAFLDSAEAPPPTRTKRSKAGERKPSSYRIDRPVRYVARLRERQTASWSALLTAINNLLLRYSAREVRTGSDPLPTTEASATAPSPEEARHLLRGYGGRVCRHLTSLTRADGVSAFWLDYSFSPPRLIRVGDYFRHPAHSAGSCKAWQAFDAFAWTRETRPAHLVQARELMKARSQNYRVAYSGIEDPSALDNFEPGYAEQSGPKLATTLASYFDCYPEPRPRDSMAVPLTVSGRVVGVLSITGIVENQFDRHLLWPLRRAAALVANCMYHESQVWHLRRLNYIFAQNGLNRLHFASAGRSANALVDVSKCLSNIFLCANANIWLQSASNTQRLELAGFSGAEMFPPDLADSSAGSPFEYNYQPPKASPEDLRRPFSSLALDLWRNIAFEPQRPPLGKFAQGCFDPESRSTKGYDAIAASTAGVTIGTDIFDDDPTSSNSIGFVRSRVFGDAVSGGYELRDILAFALVRPVVHSWKTVGVVTLHDYGRTDRFGARIRRPWDYGWAPVVAQMQTHLPHLLRQAELLYGPESSGRTYVMHALRSELLALTIRILKLQSRASASIGPLGSAYDKLRKQQAQADSTPRKQVEVMEEIVGELRDVWNHVEAVSIGVASQRIRFLANVANNYKTLASLVADITAGSDFEMVPLREMLENLISDLRAHRTPNQNTVTLSFTELRVPADLRVGLPSEWLRMIFRELTRNVEKYGSGAGISIAWNIQERALRFVNDCLYDPQTDSPERLLEYRYRGSAGKSALQNRSDPDSQPSGEGLGLWGVREICKTLDVSFDVHIAPKVAPQGQEPSQGSQLSAGVFTATLVFPAGVVNARIPPIVDNDFA